LIIIYQTKLQNKLLMEYKDFATRQFLN